MLRTLAVGHARRGHDVRVAAIISPGRDPHAFVGALEHDGVATHVVRVKPRAYLAERAAIRALCKESHLDLVHTHGFRPDVVDGSVARAEMIRSVSTCHGFIESSWRTRTYQWLQRRALRAFDAIIAVSAPIEERLLLAGVGPEKISVIPNAYTQVETPLSRDQARGALGLPNGRIIGWVGRLSAEKGLDLGIRAFARLALPDTYLLVIGEGREGQSLRDLTQSVGVADRVLWRGVIPNAGRLFAAFDAFLLSSRTEGTPMVLLEAMALGIPIVATEVGGVPAVVDASSARLARPNDVDAIANALADTFLDPHATEARVARARQILHDRFSVTSWLSRYEQVYRSLVTPGRGGTL